MGDAFNPQEILSRLRAKPVNAVSFNGNQGHNNNNNNNASAATATGTVSGASITGGLSTTAQAKGATPVSTSNATTVSAAQKMRAIPAQHPYVVICPLSNYLNLFCLREVYCSIKFSYL